jgi:selenocysteine-specific elongation factor
MMFLVIDITKGIQT